MKVLRHLNQNQICATFLKIILIVDIAVDRAIKVAIVIYVCEIDAIPIYFRWKDCILSGRMDDPKWNK